VLLKPLGHLSAVRVAQWNLINLAESSWPRIERHQSSRNERRRAWHASSKFAIAFFYSHFAAARF
jgi:hypothetical protein